MNGNMNHYGTNKIELNRLVIKLEAESSPTASNSENNSSPLLLGSISQTALLKWEPAFSKAMGKLQIQRTRDWGGV